MSRGAQCKSAASVCETAAVLLLYHGTVKQLLLPFYDLFMGAQANVGESANAELQDSGIAGSWYHGRYNIAGSWQHDTMVDKNITGSWYHSRYKIAGYCMGNGMVDATLDCIAGVRSNCDITMNCWRVGRCKEGVGNIHYGLNHISCH